MNRPTKQIYIGAPISNGDEARFLREVHRDLGDAEALILANFFIGPRQIDFVVVTRKAVAVLELKCLSGPIFGGENGYWFLENAAGQRVSYDGGNPFAQTLEQKYALSDAMARFQRKTAGVHGPAGKKFAYDLLAFVCVHPTLDPASSIAVREYMVEVAGYNTIRARLRSLESGCRWDFSTWHAFAHDLGLVPASLEGACDEKLQRADDNLTRYRERLQATIGKALAPLTDDNSGVSGQPLIERLLQPKNVLLIGPSGSTKSFHLEHLVVALARRDEDLPILLRAGHFEGGSFAAFLNRELAPYTADKAAKLVITARRHGRRPVLIIDALNECPDRLLTDLLHAVQAFAIRHGGRVVLSAQADLELPSELESERILLPLPGGAMKRAIYAYHAGIEADDALDALCSGFTNAYDLVVAGRCHRDGPPPTARTQLYDRYVRKNLGSNNISGIAFFRAIAHTMSTELAFSVPRDEFDQLAERFAHEHRIPLATLDAIVLCGLLVMRAETVAFEHELLLMYFQALDFHRQQMDEGIMAAELDRPRHRKLRQFILPRLTNRSAVAEILNVASDVEFLTSVANGECGDLPRDVIIDECNSMLDFAFDDLTHLNASCETADAGDGRRRLVSVVLQRDHAISKRHDLVFTVIGQTLYNTELLGRVLALIEATEDTLRALTSKAAKHSRFKAVGVWATAIHHIFVLKGNVPQLPLAMILHSFSDWARWGRGDRRDATARTAIRRLAVGSAPSDIAVLYTCELQSGLDNDCNVPEILGLVAYAWSTGIYILRVAAMNLIQQTSHAIHTRYTDQLPAVRELLTSFNTDNIFESTSLVDALSAYDALEGLPTASEAAAEIRGIIAGSVFTSDDASALATLSGMSPDEARRSAAYGVISRIFEGPFGNAYSEAYHDLDDSGRCMLLTLALMREDDIGTHVPWMLTELINLKRVDTVPIFRRFAAELPTRERSFSTQEDVARYLLGLKGCADWIELPPEAPAGTTPHEVAWRLLGEIAFWYYRFGASAKERTSKLWREFPNTGVAAGVLSDVMSANIIIYFDELKIDVLRHWPDEVRVIAEGCLRDATEIVTLRPYRHSDPREYVIGLLADVGDRHSLPLLHALTEDADVGMLALTAIESIQRRGA